MFEKIFNVIKTFGDTLAIAFPAPPVVDRDPVTGLTDAQAVAHVHALGMDRIKNGPNKEFADAVINQFHHAIAP